MQNCSYVQIAISLAAVSHVLQTWNEGSDIVSVFLQLSEEKVCDCCFHDSSLMSEMSYHPCFMGECCVLSYAGIHKFFKYLGAP